MIYTSNYSILYSRHFKNEVISISGDRGRSIGYLGEYYSLLAPKKKEFWDEWKKNIGKVDEEENNKFYIRKYYDTVLKGLDVDEVHKELDERILLCYERPDQFCHRQIVAAWFELFLGEKVPEVRANDYKLYEVTDRAKIKDYLNEYIISQTDMRGFHSLRALHYYEKGERLEKVAKNSRDIELSKFLKILAFDTDMEEDKEENKKYIK